MPRRFPLRMGMLHHIATLAILVAAPGSAQSVASLAVSAGSATDITGAGSSAVTIAPSIARVSGASTSSFSASATKFANDAWSAGLAAALSGRAQARTITPVIDLAFSAATTSYDFSYASADVVPALEVRSGAAKFFGGARLAGAGTSSTLSTTGSQPLGPVPGSSRTTQSQAATTAIGGVSFTSVASAGEVMTLAYRAEAGTVAAESQVDQGLHASIASSKVVIGAAVGRRARAGQSTTYGTATLGVAVAPAVLLQISGGTYPSNPMFGTAAGRFVNAGFSMRLQRRAGTSPAPSNVRPPLAGWTRISIRATDASRVELAGDFNKWKSIAATRADNGVWYVDLDLPPGEYRYAFRVNGKEWRVPEGVAAVDDEFGGKSAWLTVSRPTVK
jgi:hypothetical protein